MEKSVNINPVSWDLAPGPDELSAMRTHLVDAGIRELPYPFQSALSLTSDIDCSNTEHFKGHIGQIVHEHGLDFGDSVWLQTNKCGGLNGLAFLSWYYTFWTKRTHTRSDEFDHHDLAEQYHRGNIDHWHCFIVRGPRFVMLNTAPGPDARQIIAKIPPRHRCQRDPYYGTQYIQTAALGLIHDRTENIEVDCVVIRNKVFLRGRERIYERSQFGTCHRMDGHTNQISEELAITFLPLVGKIDEEREIPWLENVDSFEIHLRHANAMKVQNIVVYNTYTDVLIDRLTELQHRFNVCMNLLTIHGEWMIPHYRQYNRQKEKFRNKVDGERSGKLESLYGSGVINGLKFSSNADEPFSFVRLYPEILTECGVRFWRPTGNGDLLRGISEKDATRYCEILDVVTPAMRRDGGGIYLLTTTKARVRKKTGDPGHDRKSTARSFAERCKVILDDFREQPGRVAVMYTHLGNLEPGNKVSKPYFGEDLFRRLRRLCYGIVHSPDEGPRLWFTRASVISDYALLLRGIGRNIERVASNTIRIKYWMDPYMNVTLPRGLAQLYGMTFYVDDPHSARVFLEEKEITSLVRNPPDATGRASVTVAACEIGHVVMGGLDPAVTTRMRKPGQGRSAVYEYRNDSLPEDPPAGFLRIRAQAVPTLWDRFGRAHKNLYGVAMHRNNLFPAGSQHFRVVLRRGTPGTHIGFLVRTAGGGKFFFGDPELLKSVSPVTASYDFAFKGCPAGQWRTVVVPFYDLHWSLNEKTDPLKVPLPAHKIVAVEIHVVGSDDSYVDVSEMAFERPRTVSGSEQKHIIVGGRIKPGRQGVTVYLRRCDGIGTHEISTRTDELGGFSFPQTPRGGYELWTDKTSLRPLRVECLYDRYDLRLRV